MDKGTKWILVLSAAAGLGAGIVPSTIQYRSCQADLKQFSADRQDFVAALRGEKRLDQISTPALIRALQDDDFRKGVWHPPICQPVSIFRNYAFLGVGLFFLLFVVTHAAWLLGRAYGKLMRSLK